MYGGGQMNSTHMYDRRRFLQYVGIAGLGMATPFMVTTAQATDCTKTHQVSQTLPMMNTLVSITVRDQSEQRARTAQQAAFAAARELIPIFDRFQPDSHVSSLNRHGVLKDIPSHLRQVLQTSRDLYQMSQRRFDVTILPLLQATGHELGQRHTPVTPSDLRQLQALVGCDHLHLGSKSVRLGRSGMGITLDGIAKGYIVDQVAATLTAHGITSALINAGGDIRVIGNKGSAPWQVGVQDPTHRHASLATLGLRNAAVATSGSYEQFFDPLARHHHLLSQAGHSPRRPVSSTVIAPTAMQADGLATTIFLLPPEEGLTLAAAQPGVQAAVVTRGNRMMTTPGWNRLQLS